MKCAICGKQLELRNLAYLRGDIAICTDCFPDYYVRNLCKLVQKRVRGEQPIACQACRFRKVCDRYIKQISAAVK